MPSVTFVIPCGPHHAHLLPRALASVEAQTVPASVVVVNDTARRGAGYARNRGLARVETPFVTFLDADDEVLPTFVEQTLSAYQPGYWVYSDWLDGEVPYSAPNCPWMPGTRNVITTLLSTADARAVGGFDETLDGLEDTDLYLRLLKRGVCGLKVPTPLFRYGAEGERSKAFYATPAFHAAMRRFSDVYKELNVSSCGGCGAGNDGPIGGVQYAFDPNYDPDGPIGDPEPDDELAVALWGGNQRRRGRMTGRLYPRAGNGKRMWVSPRDMALSPDWWAAVDLPKDTPPPAPPGIRDTRPPTRLALDTAAPMEPAVLDGVKAIGQTLFKPLPFPSPLTAPKDTTPRNPAPAKPNARKARELYEGRQ